MTQPWQTWERRPPFTTKNGTIVYPVYALGAYGERHEGGTVYVYAHDVDPADVEATHDQIGKLLWNLRKVQYLDVDPDWQRQGIATEMWRLAREAEPQLRHATSHRSRDGEAFIRAIDPDQAMPNFELDMPVTQEKEQPGLWGKIIGFLRR